MVRPDITFTPKPLNETVPPKYGNILKDVAIYGVYMETTNGATKERSMVFETNDKGLAEQVLTDYQAVEYLKGAKFAIDVKYVEHSTIEDGYYTYSHIYGTGQSINFTIYNTTGTYNVADIISDWWGYIVHYTTTVTHWFYTHYMWANQADGSDMYEPDYSTTSGNWQRPLYYGTYTDGIQYKKVRDPSIYTWVELHATDPLPVEAHSTFTFTSNIFDEIEEVHGISPINKRNFRYDTWKYQENTTYPFIGG